MKLIALALALAILPRATQEKITFKHNPAKGDKLTQVEKMVMKLDLTVKAGDQTIKLNTEQKNSKKGTMEVLEVEGGKVTKARFHIEEDVQEQKEPGAEAFTKTDQPLHGRKITVTTKDGKPTYEGADGIEEKALKKLDLEDDFSKVFPKNAVAVGESWTVGAEALKEMFDDDKMEGKMTLKLVEVKEYEGKKCGFLDAKLELKNPVAEGVIMNANLAGTVIVWIERGYAIKAKLEGKVVMSGNPGGAEMSGEGPMTAEMSTTVK